ncbi:MAG: STAS domain-containing protein [Gemmatimonadales bacterium]
MRIAAERGGGSARLTLEGRLDREWAERLAHALEELLRDGVRSLDIDLERVTYVSSAATTVLSRCQRELALLRGEVRFTAVPAAVNRMFDIAGWAPMAGGREAAALNESLRRSSWKAALDLASGSRPDMGSAGQVEVSAAHPDGSLSCRVIGDPARLGTAALGERDCATLPVTGETFALGIGAIGDEYAIGHGRLGELAAVAGCVAHFPGDGARLADYVVGAGSVPPQALLGLGLVCEGGFSHLLRFSPYREAGAVPLSDLAAAALKATGSATAGLVVAGETAGVLGTRLSRSPTTAPVSFDVPGVRDWLSFSPEPTYPRATAIITGVVARTPDPALAPHLRPLTVTRRLWGHFHAAVFSYRPLPQRTVELGALARTLFTEHQLRDVLHLLCDFRGVTDAAETTLVRGVAWAGPISRLA